MKIYTPLFAALIAGVTLPALATDSTTDASVAAPAGNPETTGYLARASELAVRALALIGVHYKYGSNSPDKGFDCSGLVSHVFQEVAGIVLPRNSQSLRKVGEKVDKADLQPGDLVFFNTRKRAFSHVGIYIGDARFVHAPSRGGEVEIAD